VRDVDFTLNYITEVAGIPEIIGFGPRGPRGADGSGVPAGGVDGQVLTKLSETDADVGWETPPPVLLSTDDLTDTADHWYTNDSDVTRLSTTSGYNTGDQDLSGLVVKVAGKDLSTNDYTTAEKTKLAGVAIGATQNATDADLRDRSTHTGTQAVSTVTGLQTSLDGKQPLDSDLSAVAALTPTDDDVLQRKAGSWTSRTPNQLKADLAVTKSDVGLSNVDNTSDLNKPASTAVQTALDQKVIIANDLSGTPTSPVVAPAYQPNSQRQPNSTDTLLTAFQSPHGFGIVSANGSQTNDTTNFVRGSQSLKIVTNGLGNPTTTQKSSISPTINVTGKSFKVKVMADKPTNITQLYFYFSSDNVVANWFTVKPSNYIQVLKPNVWTTLTFSQGRDAQTTGAPNLAAINALAVRVVDDGTTVVNVNVNEISTFNPPSQGIVTFSFDDNKASQYSTAKPVLDGYSYPATVYTIPSKVGTTNYMTLAQLKTLQSNGWDISNHTWDHPYLSALTDAQIEAEFYQSKQWLLTNGFTKGANDMALPHGDYNDDHVLPIARKYFRSVRTINHQVETYPAADPYRLRTFYILSSVTLAQAKTAVDQAIANKEWLLFTFHDLESPTTAPESWLPADFQSLVAYVNASGATVKTVADVFNHVGFEKVSKAGDTMTGPLVLNSPTADKSLEVASNNSGGLNNSDSTGRMNLHSYQKAQLNNATSTNVGEAHYGEVIRIDLEHQQAKGIIAFRENYLGAGYPRTVAWLVAHGVSNDDPNLWHNHFSIEIPDETGALQTALEFPFGAYNVPNAFGIPVASQYVRSVRNFLAAGQGITVEGLPATDRSISFSSTSYGDSTGKRWSIVADSTAESGSIAGSDFRINRRNDSGVFLDTAFFIKRSTGQIGVGNVLTPAARFDASASGSLYHTIQAQQTTTSTSNFAAYSAIVGLATNKVLDARVTGDTSGRLAVLGSGQIEWGPGTAGRDVTLYRSAANVLKTDDKFTAALGINMGTGVAVPATATSAGTAGDVAYDSSFVYVCVATNTWKRSALSSW
jgi:peptidoglycan/xylan/chitin deacetylase (PgdA/CDA1 family)